MEVTLAVGVQIVRPPSVEVTGSQRSEKSKWYLHKNIYPEWGHSVPGVLWGFLMHTTSSDGVKVWSFLSRRSQRAEQRDIAAHAGIHPPLPRISSYTHHREYVCACSCHARGYGSPECRWPLGQHENQRDLWKLLTRARWQKHTATRSRLNSKASSQLNFSSQHFCPQIHISVPDDIAGLPQYNDYWL